MGRKRFPSAPVLWNRHEQLYTEVFEYALQRLAEIGCDVSHEDAISEALCPILNEVCFEERAKTKREIRTPDWEKKVQPVVSSELRGGKASKRPDFTCKLFNPHASSSEEHELNLHIECKRLGKSTSRTWILNENYVVDGIMRFDSDEHEYGKRVSSGIMVGYIISMTACEILVEIDNYHIKHCSRPTEITHQYGNDHISQFRQHIDRKHVKPESFDIVHIWVDLKK